MKNLENVELFSEQVMKNCKVNHEVIYNYEHMTRPNLNDIFTTLENFYAGEMGEKVMKKKLFHWVEVFLQRRDSVTS